MTIEAIITVGLAYALGAFPTAYLLGRAVRRRDIRDEGSRNPGALNAYRLMGKRAGALVLAVDAGKGALAMAVGGLMEAPEVALYLAAGAAALGHNFTPFTGFRGGKGGATVLGISAATLWQITLISIGAGAAFFVLSRHPVRSVAAIFLVLNVLTIATAQPVGLILLCLSLSLLVAGTHLYREYPHMASALRRGDWRRLTEAD